MPECGSLSTCSMPRTRDVYRLTQPITTLHTKEQICLLLLCCEFSRWEEDYEKHERNTHQLSG